MSTRTPAVSASDALRRLTDIVDPERDRLLTAEEVAEFDEIYPHVDQLIGRSYLSEGLRSKAAKTEEWRASAAHNTKRAKMAEKKVQEMTMKEQADEDYKKRSEEADAALREAELEEQRDRVATSHARRAMCQQELEAEMSLRQAKLDRAKLENEIILEETKRLESRLRVLRQPAPALPANHLAIQPADVQEDAPPAVALPPRKRGRPSNVDRAARVQAEEYFKMRARQIKREFQDEEDEMN